MLNLIRQYAMSSNSNSLKTAQRNLIAVCQMTSGDDFQTNFNVCAKMIARAKERGSKMVFFPECFDYIALTKEETISKAFEEKSEYIQQFRELAKNYNIWLSLGGFHHKIPNATTLPFNTHLIIDNEGETKGSYQKLHLFNLDIPNKVRLMESEFSSNGNKLVEPVDTPIGKLGLSICYDVRFPELSLWNRYKGAEILSFPSSFTVNTGLAHWETLLRCRAIETQCYVIAAGQTGKHNEKRSSYGHSMVVDPWGTVIAQCSDTVDMCFAEIDINYVNEIRQMQPVFSHRRTDLYSVMYNTPKNNFNSQQFYISNIPKETIFYQTDYSFAFVNLKPLLPGHVLCSPIRCVKKLTDLSNQETADLFNVAKEVQKMIEIYHKATSSTIAIQDGPEAGQTVPHTHVHIMPLKKTDFGGNSDLIYQKLQGHEHERKPRELSEMINEAQIYKKLLQKTI